MEPLLRWLRVGAKGYVPGVYSSSSVKVRLEGEIPDVTYADDLNLVADTAQRLAAHADKVTQYLDWGHLRINCTKTLLTGASYKTSRKYPYNLKELGRLLSPVRVQNSVPTLHNPVEPASDT